MHGLTLQLQVLSSIIFEVPHLLHKFFDPARKLESLLLLIPVLMLDLVLRCLHLTQPGSRRRKLFNGTLNTSFGLNQKVAKLSQKLERHKLRPKGKKKTW
ncbi:hypothetical protein NE237_015881 [Protea cynaroides]|uniref:Uncharacterized protein n=1 Tax=Protea cynaroides TaxID=273540 RepID=A0A9Q0QRH4_9MAGN|nr:hypothetical protein NE237_015881 [Protea cynaroides]